MTKIACIPQFKRLTMLCILSVLSEGASEREIRDLLSEMSLLKHLDPHPHIIRLYGCVTTEGQYNTIHNNSHTKSCFSL